MITARGAAPIREEYPYTPLFLRKSAETLDSRRIALHSWLQEREEEQMNVRLPPIPHHFA
jgi:hypothetical protein